MEETDRQDESNGFTENLLKKITGMTDSGLVEILKKRAHYQPVAVSMAVREAQRRGIIASVEDLDARGFKDPGFRFTLFPAPETESSREKLFHSLLRSLMVAGIIPVAFGVLKFTLFKFVEGTAMISLGIIWIVLAWSVMKKGKSGLFYPMLGILSLSLTYVIRILLSFRNPGRVDILVSVIIYLAVFYMIFYSRSLLRKRSPDNQL